eukprot:TRINITY_DN31685_c0_g1_i1.p1 TRINITY_DN31685_c0_g1~~TRINITY_DN31685_c0_g1_i1.p1  ORF type:complete len:338 (-),score=23.19 TRINITY_DN31685_c0_g1_i1:32-1045(-)
MVSLEQCAPLEPRVADELQARLKAAGSLLLKPEPYIGCLNLPANPVILVGAKALATRHIATFLLPQLEQNMHLALDLPPHPNLVRYIGTRCNVVRQQVHIWMHHADGSPLPVLLENGFPEQQASALLRELCEAVAHLHAHNIVHSNLNPRKLLLCKQGSSSKVVVVDYVLPPRFYASSCRQRYAVDTAYLAPEIRALGPYGRSADVWAIGMIAAAVLCGPLRSGLDGEPTPEQISHLPVSAVAREWLAACLNIEPENRANLADLQFHPFIVANPRRSGVWTKLHMAVEAEPAPTVDEEEIHHGEDELPAAPSSVLTPGIPKRPRSQDSSFLRSKKPL